MVRDEAVNAGEQVIRQFSTRSIPQGMRFDYWMNSVRESALPTTDWSGISADFSVEMQEARLGCLTSIVEVMTGASRARRTRRDVDNSAESCYSLFVVNSPGYWAHNGHSQHYSPGDIVLIGSGEHDSYMDPSGFRSHILKLPTHWVQSWLPDPDLLAGRTIPKDSRWGRVLSPMVLQLTPEVAAAPPLPHGVLVDQLGTTLALIAGESEVSPVPLLAKKIQDCVRQRCAEPEITPTDVAAELDISPRILHRALAACHTTFASELVGARTNLALQLLTSSSSDQLTIAAIGRLAGFTSASYFARAMCRRTGRTPLQIRADR
jgi:AraC-like DNA-binding protein